MMHGRKEGPFTVSHFSMRFVNRWNSTMQGMKAWPNVSKYRRRSQKLYSKNYGQDGHVYNTHILTFVHSFYALP